MRLLINSRYSFGVQKTAIGDTQPIKIGLVFNFAENTFSGFDPFIAHVDSADQRTTRWQHF